MKTLRNSAIALLILAIAFFATLYSRYGGGKPFKPGIAGAPGQ